LWFVIWWANCILSRKALYTLGYCSSQGPNSYEFVDIGPCDDSSSLGTGSIGIP